MDRTSVSASAARILAHAVLVTVIKPTPTAGMILPRRFFSDFAAFFMSFLLLRVMYPDHATGFAYHADTKRRPLY